ncbi:MAG: N(5)-(carboxyethyl)ornithine synthase [Tidjanibacter sp.]|nr:N(5)-(carboxyethyl)ornithine synthase [Tidjanibacter sp.]
MKTIGFPISHKENERRRALLPQSLESLQHPEMVVIEEGYGQVLGYGDEEYTSRGARVASHEQVLTCEIICDAKIGDGDYLTRLHNQTLFGWLHAVRNREIADALIEGGHTAYAWEDMFENGVHTFHRNNEIAGEAAIAHSFMIHGILPEGCKVAVIGRGNTARGAIKTLNALGAEVKVFGRADEERLRAELGEYDVVVNAVLWDTRRKDHIIYKEDLGRMKRGAMIVDIACDRGGAIETSIPTTIEEPSYFCEGVRHYVVDHTPALFYRSTSVSLAEEVAKYVDLLIEGKENEVLKGAKIVERGEILDQRIIEFQGR